MNYGVSFLDGRTVGDRICEGNSEFNYVCSSVQCQFYSDDRIFFFDRSRTRTTRLHRQHDIGSLLRSRVSSSEVCNKSSLPKKKSIRNHQSLKRSTMRTWQSINSSGERS